MLGATIQPLWIEVFKSCNPRTGLVIASPVLRSHQQRRNHDGSIRFSHVRGSDRWNGPVARRASDCRFASIATTAARAVTVSGCVARAQENPPGTTGTASTRPETRFVLTSAAVKTDETAGTTGTTAPPATAIACEYRLDSDETQLAIHVGQKVEITGTMEQPSRTEQKPPASAASAPTLKVDTVKMPASTCS